MCILIIRACAETIRSLLSCVNVLPDVSTKPGQGGKLPAYGALLWKVDCDNDHSSLHLHFSVAVMMIQL